MTSRVLAIAFILSVLPCGVRAQSTCLNLQQFIESNSRALGPKMAGYDEVVDVVGLDEAKASVRSLALSKLHAERAQERTDTVPADLYKQEGCKYVWMNIYDDKDNPLPNRLRMKVRTFGPDSLTLVEDDPNYPDSKEVHRMRRLGPDTLEIVDQASVTDPCSGKPVPYEIVRRGSLKRSGAPAPMYGYSYHLQTLMGAALSDVVEFEQSGASSACEATSDAAKATGQGEGVTPPSSPSPWPSSGRTSPAE